MTATSNHHDSMMPKLTSIEQSINTANNKKINAKKGNTVVFSGDKNITGEK